ncbi:MAG: PEGA domain-containing protein [Phycisphaerae bacterium]|nr:PEGA domain-containing protein [Phycisphaerae bacterium]
MYCIVLGLPAAVGCEDGPRTILVQTQPSGASVWIDGQLVGGSPCKVQWKDTCPEDLWELHVIDVKADGYEPHRKEIRYRSGAAWLPERLELTLTPTDASVIRGGEESPFPPIRKSMTITWTPGEELAVLPAPAKDAVGPKDKTPPPGRDKPTEREVSLWRPKGRAPRTPVEPQKTPEKSKTTSRVILAPAASEVEIPRESSNPRTIPVYPAEDLLACEVRLVRLSDGRVIAQASLQGPYARRKRMADVLVKLLARQAPDDAFVAVGCLSNRRRGPDGQKLSDEMTRAVERAVRREPGLRYVRRVNLRNVILDEEMVESAKIVADRRIAHLFDGAQYVIVGGAARAVPVPAEPREEEE